MHRSIPAHALWAAAMLLAASTAHATSTASTVLADFGISLTDLAPSDGIAPTLTLDPLSRSTAAPGAVSPGANTFWIRQGDSAFGPVSSSGEIAGAGGSAAFAGDPFGAGARITASATGGPSFAIGSGAAYIDTQPTGFTELLLGPRTQVVFSGLAQLDWNASNPAAAAYGEIDLAFWRRTGDSEELVAQQYATGGYYGDGAGALSGSTAGTLAIAFANDSDAAVALGYEVSVFANAAELETVPSPVDEPAGAVLMLAGAAALWRRRRGAAPSVDFSGGSGACP